MQLACVSLLIALTDSGDFTRSIFLSPRKFPLGSLQHQDSHRNTFHLSISDYTTVTELLALMTT
jgi:hypothetical protein